MNAPPGVDTDTSGEETTPPPSPKIDPPKPQFSLVSAILPTRRLNKLRKKSTFKIKSQTPEEARDTKEPEKTGALKKEISQTGIRLAKKRVRIVENLEEAEGQQSPLPLVGEGKDKQEPDHTPLTSSMTPTSGEIPSGDEVISLLRQLMAKNTLSDTESSVDDPGSPVESTTPEDPSPMNSGNIELPTPTGPAYAKRRPIGLDFSNLFKSKAKSRPPPKAGMAGPTSAPPPVEKAEAGIAPASASGNEAGNDPLPATAPPWLWTGPDTGPQHPHPPYYSRPLSPEHPTHHQHPPWLWTGPYGQVGDPAANRGPTTYDNSKYGRAYSAPQSPPGYPPYPPYYPHPQSLQPWQPYYPPWTAPVHTYGAARTDAKGSSSGTSAENMAYDGLAPAVGTGTTAERKSASGDSEGQYTRPTKAKLKPAAVESKSPTITEVGSIAGSIKPEHGVHKSQKKMRKVIGVAHNIRDHHSTRHELGKSRANDGSKKAHDKAMKEDDVTWADCLGSLTMCIRLGRRLLKYIELGNGSGEEDADRHHFLHLLSSILISLLVQRDVVRELSKLVGDGHAEEITRFSLELQRINTFLRGCLEKKRYSSKNTKRLSEIYGQASRSLEAGGLSHLMKQVLSLTDYLTPGIMKPISDLIRDWADDKLDAKVVLKALMRIQHEIAKIHGQKQGKESVSDASDGIWQLLGYVDVLYRLFVSDDETDASHDVIPGSWPAERPEHDKLKSSPSISRRRISADAHSIVNETQILKSKTGVGEQKTALDENRSPTHRSPKQVLSDMMHPRNAGAKERSAPEVRAAAHKTDVAEDVRKISKPSTAPLKIAKSRPTITQMELPELKVKPYKHSSATPPRRPPTPIILSSDPATPVSEFLDSSPSQYSQDEDEIDSDGTVSSDNDAQSLLGHADSGPARRTDAPTPKTSPEPEKEQIEHAKEVLSGEVAPPVRTYRRRL